VSNCYLDTSALAKWYVNEPQSEQFERFIRDLSHAVISRLTACEMRCLLARRRRAGDIDRDYEQRAYSCFVQDIAAGHLIIHSCRDVHLVEAVNLIDQLAPIPLRTLDAIHLALAMDAGVEAIATADNIMAQAASELELTVHFFGNAPSS
jgi:hypothetical protein